jgi:hypothetical protein
MISVNDDFRPSTRFHTPQTSSTSAFECDWCGRDVRRESAHERVQRTDDGIEVVILCPECELGEE